MTKAEFYRHLFKQKKIKRYSIGRIKRKFRFHGALYVSTPFLFALCSLFCVCFSCRITSFGVRELFFVILVHLLSTCVFVFFLVLLVWRFGCSLWIWHTPTPSVKVYGYISIISAMFSKGDDFRDFLIAYLEKDFFPKWGVFLKKRKFSDRSKLFSVWYIPKLYDNNENDRVASPESVLINRNVYMLLKWSVEVCIAMYSYKIKFRW